MADPGGAGPGANRDGLPVPGGRGAVLVPRRQSPARLRGRGAVLVNVLLPKRGPAWFTGREIGTPRALLVSSCPIGIAAALVVLPWPAAHASTAAAFAAPAAAAAAVLALVALIYRAPP